MHLLHRRFIQGAHKLDIDVCASQFMAEFILIRHTLYSQSLTGGSPPRFNLKVLTYLLTLQN